MFLANDKEERRSQLWRISMVVATIIILLVGSYLLHKMFTENPITGVWTSQTRDITMTIHNHGEVEISGADFYESGTVSYHMNTESKSVSFTLNQGDTIVEALEVEDKITYTSTYNYSVEQEILILTDMEFGDSESFIKL